MDLEQKDTRKATLERPFHGAHTRSVDRSGRFNLPHTFRLPDEDRYVVYIGADGIVRLRPHSIWQDRFQTMAKGKTPAERREAKRKMSLASQTVEPDHQGRIAVAKKYLEAAGIDRKIAIVGMDSCMELWHPDQLEQQTGDDLIAADVLDEFDDD